MKYSLLKEETLETTPPVITSGSAGINLEENSGAGQTVYTITATDNIAVTGYELSGEDTDLLSITDNVISLDADPDFETKSSYSFSVTANDAEGNVSDVKTVTFLIKMVSCFG